MKRIAIYLFLIFVLANGAFLALRRADAAPPASSAADRIDEPEYEGVMQLLPLSGRWAVVVFGNMKEVIQKIDQLTEGEYLKAVEKWEASTKGGKPDWTAWHRWTALYKQHIAQARTLAGEKEFDRPDYFLISSVNDSRYDAPRQPARVTRTIASLGGPVIPGEKEIHWGHYCYLEFPEPLLTGSRYTILLDDGKSVAFDFDERATVSRAIKVNQAGYLPDAGKKFAYLGCYLQEFGPMDLSWADKFEVISSSTGKVVLTGKPKLRGENPHVQAKPGTNEDPKKKPLITGEDTYEIDLSGLKEEGEFYLSVPGVGRSWTFSHSQDAYGEPFYIAARGLYHQRCGIEIGKPYTDWPRIRCHTDPVYESGEIPFLPNMPKPKNYQVFDVVGATIDKTFSTKGPVRGWHDAADWDRNIAHYQCVFDLLYAYELAPRRFSDGQLNIPESGNGIPDILSEAEYGLQVWRKSLTPDFGAAGSVETSTHPPIVDPKFPYAYSKRTRWCSYVFSAACAQFAQLVEPFNAELSATYRNLAEKAYIFAEDRKHSLGSITIRAAKDRGKGTPYTMEWEEKEEYNIPYQIMAKLRLYLLTSDPSYLENLSPLLEKTQKPLVWPFGMRDFSCWLYYSLFNERIAENFTPRELSAWKKHYLSIADDLVKWAEEQPYRQSWPLFQDYWMSWGSTCMTNQARVLLLAHHLTGDRKYRDAALVNIDFMLGANPMGMSWTTGIGQVYPIDIQHSVSENDGIPDPVPGITLYGITEAVFAGLRNDVWQNETPDRKVVAFIPEKNRSIPVFRKWSCHPHLNTPQCEFTIHETSSSTIFCTAMLLPEGWVPPKRLKEQGSREKKRLFGYYYLP